MVDLEVLAVGAVDSAEDSSKRAEDSSRGGVVIQGGEGIRSMRGLRAVTDAEKRSRKIGAKCVAMEVWNL